jgi:PAS domain S-box-containing protein
MLWAIAGKSEFAFWQIADGDGGTVLEQGPADPTLPRWNGVLKEPLWTVTPDGATEEWVVPLAIGSVTKPWTFRLGFRADQIRNHIRRIVMTNALVATATSVVLVGLSFFLARQLVKPVRSLTMAANELERGNLDVSLPDAATYEIGQLVSAFRSMTGSIRERDAAISTHLASLEQSRDELETRVQERTSALVAATTRIHENEARMRAIVEHAADGIVTMSEAGIIELFNPTASAIYGYDQGELIGQPIGLLFANDWGIDADAKIVQTGAAPPVNLGRSAEVVFRRKSGEVFPGQMALSEMVVGERRLFTAIVSDISDRRRAEVERREMNERLVAASRSAGMAEVATSVLHNVGNVLTSVSVSATLLAQTVRESKVKGLGKAASLMELHASDLGAFVTADPSGRQLPEYLKQLALRLEAEQAATLNELDALFKNVEHVKAVVRMQQSYARGGREVSETLALQEVVEEALRIGGCNFAMLGVDVCRDYARMPPVVVDRHKVIQILVNLFTNAGHALAGREAARRLIVRTRAQGTTVSVVVIDNGVGIACDNLVKIFNHGFTTKREGHGFGLHASAVSAMELGGTLVAESEGIGQGARFVLTFPARAEPRSDVEGRLHA